MRAFKDMSGACFDLPVNMAQRFEDIFEYEERENRRCDFRVTKAKELPELKEDDNRGGYMGSGGYGGQRGGYGGGGYGRGGYQQRGGYGG